MKNSLLIEAYGNLTRKELKEFTLFLGSSWFNQSELLCLMHEVLLVEWPELLAEKIEKARVFSLLYPGQPYDDRKIRVLMSKLLHLIEQFWIQKSLNASLIDQKKLLFRELEKRQARRVYGRNLKEAQNWLDNHWASLNDYYLEKFQLMERESQFQIEFEGRRAGDSNMDLSQTIEFLDQHFLIQKLRFLCAAKTVENIQTTTFYRPTEEEINFLLDWAARKKEIPLVALFRQTYLSLDNPEDESLFFLLLDLLLEEYVAVIPPKMALELHTYAQNYCAGKINRGKSQFLELLFTLYKTGIEQGILFISGQLSPWMYKNITVTGLRLNAFNWIENFIREFKLRLPEEEQENAFTYNMAKYHFYRKNYSNVIKLLMRVEYNDVFYGLDSRAMMLKTYFELSEIEALDSLAQSFRIFLRRKKSISENYRKGYLNFIKYIKKLSRALYGTAAQRKQLKVDLETEDQVMDMAWLWEKVRDL